VLGYSRARGPARLLIAAMAALADERGFIDGLTTQRLCGAAGIADRTYRRVRGPLLASGELVLRSATRGRGNTNSWEIPDPRSHVTAIIESMPRRRVAPPTGVRPLVATVPRPADADLSSPVPKPGDLESASFEVVAKGRSGSDGFIGNRPIVSGVSRGKAVRTGQLRARTLRLCQGSRPQTPVRAGHFCPKTRPKTRQKTRRLTRAWVGNPRTPEPQKTPPTPLQGGAALTRSSSRRRTSPSVVANAGDGSRSTLPRRAHGWRRWAQRIAPPGSTSGIYCSRRLARACLRSGWRRSS
jgi:hypothetical protein